MDAWQSFSADKNPIDIEELCKLKCLNGSNKKCSSMKKKIHIIRDNIEWYYPKSLEDLFDLLVQYQSLPYKIVSGSTGVGVFKTDGPYIVYIDIKNISELYSVLRTDALTIGSMTTLQKLISVCNDYSIKPGFEYLTVVTAHLLRIANRHVRSVGTWAGNIMMKYIHREFPSDLFLVLETVNAKILVVGPDKLSQPQYFTPSQLLNQQMQGRILYSVSFLPYDPQRTVIKTYKTSLRSQNSHAYVNAGFKFDVDPSSLIVQSIPTIVFGGINDQFIHASNTEKFLLGRNLNDQNVLQNALIMLFNEVVPDADPVLADPEYRRMLACSLFYKYILFVNKNNLGPRLVSAIDNIIDSRQISSGIETYSDNPSIYPVTKPMSKLNSLLQTSGNFFYNTV